ncbi:MAG: hypothetical protein LBS18_06730, partial [Clostridiales bacterium]|nr:hypothetical protein [Clostridiales bacterium]
MSAKTIEECRFVIFILFRSVYCKNNKANGLNKTYAPLLHFFHALSSIKFTGGIDIKSRYLQDYFDMVQSYPTGRLYRNEAEQQYRHTIKNRRIGAFVEGF